MAFKLKLTLGCDYETYGTKDFRKEHKDDVQKDALENLTDEEVEEHPPLPVVTEVNNNTPPIFSNVVGIHRHSANQKL